MADIKRAFVTAILLCSCMIMFSQSYEERKAPVDYVSTLVGSLSESAFSTGNTYPAVAVPWGMNFWTPQTGKMGDGWTYSYDRLQIRGFKQTHQPSPWINDYGQFSIMPVKDVSLVDEEARKSWFSHKSETAHPYLYKVYLADHDIRAEMTPTERAVKFRFTYPESDKSGIIVDAFDAGSYIRVLDDSKTVVGYTTKNRGGVPDNFRNWFVIRFDRDIESFRLYDKGLEVSGRSCEGKHVVAALKFSTRRGDVIVAEAASSFISEEQAFINLREVEGRTFDSVAQSAEDIWNEMLGRIEVSGGTEDQYETFYSCLYRSLLFPRKFYEVTADGKIIHYSPYNGKICEGYMYTDTGFWDTFRSLFPLLNLVYPSVNREIQAGLVNVAQENDFLPEWASPGHRNCMIGNNSASVVADAYLKGITDGGIEQLYGALVHGTDNVHPQIKSTGRLGHEYYNTLGYVPCNVGIRENVARTLEYAYDDWCLYQISKKLGRPSSETEKWAQRALNYRNVFDSETCLMRGRKKDGTFQSPFNPYKWGDAYTEGNAWHYTWSVFHDVAGLIDLMGGDEKFCEMLDSVFVVPPIYDDSYYGKRIHEITEMQVADMGNYAHGNQPAQHMTYLYNYAGQPWKTQYWVREVMARLYSATPDGYCGDEDNGQTSAWYVFSALGFYPVCPGSDEYVIGSPLFCKAVVKLENGRKVSIEAANNFRQNVYLKNVRVNGRNWDRNYFRYEDLAGGAKILMDMSAEPNYERGVSEKSRPYSMNKEEYPSNH